MASGGAVEAGAGGGLRWRGGGHGGRGSFQQLEGEEGSASGSQQGDPFGGVLFDLALRPILDELAREFPFLVHAAFQDNMYLVGSVDVLV